MNVRATTPEAVEQPLPSPVPVPAADRGHTVEQAGEVRSSRIEALRALAALAVVASHVYALPRGFAPATDLIQRVGGAAAYAVYLFFALSGYLLFKPFAEHILEPSRRLDYRRYAINRAVRILPLYYAVLVLVLLAQYHGGTVSQWWHFGLLVENYSTSTVQTVDGPMWSLVIEVEFYVLLPLLALLVARVARRSGPRAIGALLVLGLISLLIHHYGDGRPLASRRVWDSSFPATFFFFVPGMILAVVKAQPVTIDAIIPRRLASANLWLGGGVALWAYVIGSFTLKGEIAVAIASFLVVGACVLPLRPSRILAALDWRPLAMLGVASYSLYLWHVPLLTWLMQRNVAWFGSTPATWILFVEAAAVCLPVAFLSYAVIEAPFLRLRRRWFTT